LLFQVLVIFAAALSPDGTIFLESPTADVFKSQNQGTDWEAIGNGSNGLSPLSIISRFHSSMMVFIMAMTWYMEV
jgi:hypothetical protein